MNNISLENNTFFTKYDDKISVEVKKGCDCLWYS